MSYDGNEEFWFRFLFLNDAQVAALKEHAPDAGARANRTRPDRLCGSFQLEAGQSYDWLPGLIRQWGVNEDEYGVFVSLVTEHDSEIVDVPPYVLDLHKRIGGQIWFSFTVVSPP
jgi:hypothetical protein